MDVAFVILSFVLAFFAAGAGDYLEARYVRAVRDNDAEGAARNSIAMMLVGAICIYVLVEVSPWVLVPESLGMYLGTKMAMK